MSNGKEGWKVGTSFLRPPVFVHNLSNANEPEPDDESPRIVTNDNIIADVYLRLRDASTLQGIPHGISNPEIIDKVSICGRVGSEIVVASTGTGIEAEVVHWNHDEDGDIPPIQGWGYNGNSVSGVETIGCETHLIVAHDGVIRLYEVKEELEEGGGVQELFIPRNRIRVNESVVQDEEGAFEDVMVKDMKLAWGPDATHFIVASKHKICVLRLDANEISLVKTIDTEWEVTNVALAEDYIVASSKDKKVHIWNRSTGEKIVYVLQGGKTRDALCDVGADDELRQNEMFAHPLHFSCHGSILVSTSHIGCAVCVWDMKTGELLKRRNEADEQGGEKMLAEGGKDVTDMVHLKKLNAFICTGEYENMWAFPTNQRQYDMVVSINQRLVDESR